LLLLATATAISFHFGCSNTTKESEEIENYVPDSTNSNADNSINRDSADIKHATESGGGTGNPSNRDSTH